LEVAICDLKLGRGQIFTHGFFRAWCINAFLCFKERKSYTGEYLAHYYLSVNAMTQPMMVREDQASYGGEKS
jgi:hypothetical protein